MANKFVITSDLTGDAIRKIANLSDDALDDFGMACKDYTASIAPVAKRLGGTHKRSITYKDGQLYSSSGYGGYLEFGTRKMAARPHFRTGINKAIREFNTESRWGE